mmetsp:Transcript_74018/g.163642  ORF Transcript_74018/g.163642 Transcript_74018/m.163642 type:complete len:312 (-) Transcript_74018:1512-2447(-)
MHSCEDVPGAGVVGSALDAGAKLPGRHQEVQVVGAHKILRHRDDGASQGRLSMMVGTVLADVADQLRYLNVASQVPLEATIENLPLRRLEPIHHRRHTSHDTILRELYKLQLHEVLVGDGGLGVVDASALLISVHPRLPIVGSRLGESHVDQLPIFVGLPFEVQAMLVKGREVLLGLSSGASAQALIVLDVPALRVATHLLLPGLIFHLCEEGVHLGALRCLHNRGHELFHEAALLQQVRPPVMEEVNKQPLDVRAIIILIRHDHDGAVAHLAQIPLLAEAEAKNLHDAHDLLVLGDLLLRDVSNVEKFSP